jgi:hypothetical protein
MGLDMYASKAKYNPESQVDFKVPEDAEKEELYYWRKHPNLHGWMEALYRSKGGTEEFNCVNVMLTEADLKKLKSNIEGNSLPSTSGFFFGQSYGNEEEKEQDLKFVELALDAIEEGYMVYYSSWW